MGGDKKNKQKNCQEKGLAAESEMYNTLILGTFSEKAKQVIKSTAKLYRPKEKNPAEPKEIENPTDAQIIPEKYDFIVCSDEIYQKHQKIVNDISGIKRIMVLTENSDCTNVIKSPGISHVTICKNLDAIISLEGYQIQKTK